MITKKVFNAIQLVGEHSADSKKRHKDDKNITNLRPMSGWQG